MRLNIGQLSPLCLLLGCAVSPDATSDQISNKSTFAARTAFADSGTGQAFRAFLEAMVGKRLTEVAQTDYKNLCRAAYLAWWADVNQPTRRAAATQASGTDSVDPARMIRALRLDDNARGEILKPLDNIFALQVNFAQSPTAQQLYFDFESLCSENVSAARAEAPLVTRTLPDPSPDAISQVRDVLTRLAGAAKETTGEDPRSLVNFVAPQYPESSQRRRQPPPWRFGRVKATIGVNGDAYASFSESLVIATDSDSAPIHQLTVCQLAEQIAGAEKVQLGQLEVAATDMRLGKTIFGISATDNPNERLADLVAYVEAPPETLESVAGGFVALGFTPPQPRPQAGATDLWAQASAASFDPDLPYAHFSFQDVRDFVRVQPGEAEPPDFKVHLAPPGQGDEAFTLFSYDTDLSTPGAYYAYCPTIARRLQKRIADEQPTAN